MYAAFFALRDMPFAITPDPAYLYLSLRHQEALAHLLYGTGEDGGFVQLTGEVGTGKTTLIRTLLEQRLENVDVALCLNPRLTAAELVATVCDELGAGYPREATSLKPLLDALNRHLLQTHAAGRRTVLIIDEAQNLSHDVLEQVRLLTNLETHRHKLLRIILVGQPELGRLLERQDLRQLAQRITARYHLLPLTGRETAAYVRHRLAVAGGREALFTPAALRAVARLSRGVPRLINVICDRALLGAYVRNTRPVTARLVRQAAAEALHGPPRIRRRVLAGIGGSVALAGVIGAAVGLSVLESPLSLLSQSEAPPPRAATLAAVHQPPVHQPPDPAPPATPSPPPDPVARLLATPGDDPLGRLLAVWNIKTEASAGPLTCDQAAGYGLRCLEGRAGWDEVRRYNRPAVLQLADPDGGLHPVVLHGLNGATATLDADPEPVTIDLQRLTPLWTGDYVLFWRPALADALIGPGSQGEAVRWLRRRLALAEGREPPAETLSGSFDFALREQVRRFQTARQLAA
ncbi:MAG: AAA family ATPase, partial [Pseudomonadota bacterium]|nr:AAA family ATPase [Pseudomonadota bacterium]